MIDIVIPVYAGFSETVRCIKSVLASRAWVQQAFELIIIDDCGKCADIERFLDGLQECVGVTVLRNECNKGFVASANRGLFLHADRDVVLLNSDTEVASNWLDRLHACAYRSQDIGTVTPFSNNATICSFPEICQVNPLSPEMTVGSLDAIFAQANDGRFIEIPTAVGFCMYIRRECIKTVGTFDEVRFGRGYGEENDFCRRAVTFGWCNVLAADTFVFHSGGASFGAEQVVLRKRAEEALAILHPDYFDVVRAFVRNDPPAELRRAVEIEIAHLRIASSYRKSFTGASGTVQLHVIHDMGGGIERWCRDFCSEDETAHLVLKPFYSREMAIEGCMLMVNPDSPIPIGYWRFDEPFEVTAVHHEGYAKALEEIVTTFRVGVVIVSSVIGHALDILRTGLPTLWVGHDYFPLCPQIHLHYGQICGVCDDDRLADCTQNNHEFNAFPGLHIETRLAIRHEWMRLLEQGTVTLVSPTREMRQRVVTLFPRTTTMNWVHIPHGVNDDLYGSYSVTSEMPAVQMEQGLRILVLGQLSFCKGLRLLEELLELMGDTAEFHLVGTQEMGDLFIDHPSVKVVKSYSLDALSEIVAGVRPHLGLLLSVWPETYSYTLTELMRMGVPPMATRCGAFAERIIDCETGFLVELRADAIAARLQTISSDNTCLEHVRACLLRLPHRNVASMINDYRYLLRIDAAATLPIVAPRTAQTEVALRQAMQLIAQRKRIKSLELESEIRAERLRRMHSVMDQAASVRREAAQMREDLDGYKQQLALMVASNSWRMTSSLRRLRRWLGGLILKQGWHDTGPHAYKTTDSKKTQIVEMSARQVDPAQIDWRQLAYLGYCEALVLQRPAFNERLAALSHQPLISILVPTYNTAPAMLTAMLESVLAQWYPNWELCVADDGSSDSGVRDLLESYARQDSRVRLTFAETNRGVANASNRALAMAQGAFILLLDHDDMLEPHALLRVGESIVRDDPDFLYGDEVLMEPDGKTVRWFVFRPSFSPEYLRAHPYIVHPVGFRRALLTEVGGFDESLHISQDYDLILRGAARAQTIVHVPEILYRWRLHDASSGHRQMTDVMETSKSILRRYLESCGETGTVDKGQSFNFFDIRYPLELGLRIAVVIPTKNRHDLVARCIESIRRTAGEVSYDIFLVDHASDNPESIRAFEVLRPQVKNILRYEAPFNFSAINNWVVHQVGGSYSHFLFCNNDIEGWSAGWLQRMLELGQKPGIGIVGAKLYYGDRQTLQHAGICVGAYGIAENLGRGWKLPIDRFEAGYLGSLIANHEVSAVTAACLLISRKAYDSVGGFSEDLAVGYGDVDLCLRASDMGYRVVLCPAAVLVHHESQTRGPSTGASHPEDSEQFSYRWAQLISAGDPYYSPNLVLDDTKWAVRVPVPIHVNFRRRIAKRLDDGRLEVNCKS